MFKEAKRLLKLALIKYSAASVHQDHVVVVASRDLLDFYGKQVEDEIEQNRFCSSLSGRFNTKLSLIPEEPLTERRKSY
jgi:RNase P protein component